MAEMVFADGKRTVDDELQGPLTQVTNGVPQSFTFLDAMKLLGRWQEKQILREAQASVIRKHFGTWRSTRR